MAIPVVKLRKLKFVDGNLVLRNPRNDTPIIIPRITIDYRKQCKSWGQHHACDLGELYLSPEKLSEVFDTIASGKDNFPLPIADIWWLSLNFTRVKECPPNMIRFENLRRLDLNNCNMKRISDSLCYLSNLEILIASFNKLYENSFPPHFAMLTKLEDLELGHNDFQTIPSPILELPSLRFLSLEYNDLEMIPPEIGNLEKLEELCLSNNKLKDIPDAIGKLVQLKYFTLRHNMLETLPNSIGDLKNLQHFDIDKNKLTTLPPKAITMTKLRGFFLDDNPWIQKLDSERYNTIQTLKISSLMELAARCVLAHQLPRNILPPKLLEYLEKAQPCDNPDCNGVYFTNYMTEIEFVDFINDTEVPIKQNLCSLSCADD